MNADCRGRARNIYEIKVKNEPNTSAVEMAEVYWSKLVKYSRLPLCQNSIYNPRIQYFLFQPQALALYAGF